ncbi:hypothetical protein AAVH_16827 [Aphelenchoides avenae]|nr:hypothetical protein AAVH_16827 [Aphelenchus avenae]
MTLLEVFDWIVRIFTAISVFITTPIYISMLIAIYRRRHKQPFSSPFFRIFGALGVVDLVCYYLNLIKKGSYWSVEFGLFHPFDQTNPWATIVYFFIWQQAFMQFQLNILISVNRFLSIMFPKYYYHYWTNKATNIMIGFMIAVTMFMAAPIGFVGSGIVTATVTDGGQNITRFTGPAFLNAQAGTQSKKFLIEVKLLYSVVILVIVNLIYTGNFIFREQMLARYQTFGRFSEWSLYLLADIYDMHNPYGLVFTSKEIRRALLPKWCKSSKIVTLTVAKNTRPSQRSVTF